MKKKIVTLLLSFCCLLGITGMTACGDLFGIVTSSSVPASSSMQKEQSSSVESSAESVNSSVDSSTESVDSSSDSSTGSTDSSVDSSTESVDSSVDSSTESTDSSSDSSTESVDSSVDSSTESVDSSSSEKDPPTPTEGLEYTLSEDGSYYIVSRIGTATDTDIVIPETYNNLPVKEIGNSAFAECSSLTSVTIPDSVTSIGNLGFVDCDSLTSVVIPDSVTTIGERAFAHCYKLVEVINKSSLVMTAGGGGNGDVAYYAKQVITDEADSNIINQDGYLFYNDNESYSLLGYTGTETELVLPDDINGKKYAIYQYAFYDRRSLTSVTIGDSVTTIGKSAFSDCYRLTSVTIPDSVTMIGEGAFSYCLDLTSVTIGDSVTTIGEYAFFYCYNLTSVTIGDSVTTIGEYAFSNCGLTSVTIPDSVTTIGKWAFSECNALTNITVEENNPNYKSIDGNLYSKDGSILIQYAIGKTATEFIIPDSVTTIGEGAFFGCRSLTSVTLGDSVAAIELGAFLCNALTNITVEENNPNYKSIDGNLYSKDGSILIQYAIGKTATEFIIPDSVTTIGDLAFYSCRSLTSVTIGDLVTTIGESAFSDCGLTSITIPDSVTSIGNHAFSGCYSLTSVTFKNPNGWAADSTQISATDLADTWTAETYLRSTYSDCTWTRS